MEFKKQQRGITAIGLLLVLIMGGFFALVAIRLVPVYLTDFNISSVLRSLSEDSARLSSQQGNSLAAMRDSLAKRLVLNNIREVEAKDVELTPTPEGVVVHLAYESRVTLFANIDVVVRFDHTEVVPTQ